MGCRGQKPLLAFRVATISGVRTAHEPPDGPRIVGLFGLVWTRRGTRQDVGVQCPENRPDETNREAVFLVVFQMLGALRAVTVRSRPIRQSAPHGASRPWPAPDR